MAKKSADAKLYTKSELLEKIEDRDSEFFSQIYYDNSEILNKTKIVWDLNYGEGNDWYVTLYFPDESMYVLLEGTYSSYDSSSFGRIHLAMPFEFKETRYRPISIAEFRDMKIDDIQKL